MTLYSVSWVNSDGIRITRDMPFRSAVAATLWLVRNATNMVGATVLPARGAGEIADKLNVWVAECQRRAG